MHFVEQLEFASVTVRMYRPRERAAGLEGGELYGGRVNGRKGSCGEEAKEEVEEGSNDPLSGFKKKTRHSDKYASFPDLTKKKKQRPGKEGGRGSDRKRSKSGGEEPPPPEPEYYSHVHEGGRPSSWARDLHLAHSPEMEIKKRKPSMLARYGTALTDLTSWWEQKGGSVGPSAEEDPQLRIRKTRKARKVPRLDLTAGLDLTAAEGTPPLDRRERSKTRVVEMQRSSSAEGLSSSAPLMDKGEKKRRSPFSAEAPHIMGASPGGSISRTSGLELPSAPSLGDLSPPRSHRAFHVYSGHSQQPLHEGVRAWFLSPGEMLLLSCAVLSLVAHKLTHSSYVRQGPALDDLTTIARTRMIDARRGSDVVVPTHMNMLKFGDTMRGLRFWQEHVREAGVKWATPPVKESAHLDVTTSWQLELGNHELRDLDTQALHVDVSQTYYSDYMADSAHTHFFFPKETRPLVLSVSMEGESVDGVELYKALLRSRGQDELFFVPVPDKSTPKQMARALRSSHPQLAEAVMLEYNPKKHPTLNGDLVNFEQQLSSRQFRVGVLQLLPGQTEELEWYGNNEATPHLLEFMDLLAECVGRELEEGELPEPGELGHGTAAAPATPNDSKYRGGLDNSAVFYHSDFSVGGMDLEVAFHVCPLLAPLRTDEDMSRKRYIGNDVVLILFKDPDSDVVVLPEDIRSNMNSVIIIVQPNSAGNGYKLAVAAKPGVAPILPLLPYPAVISKKNFREFFLAKVVNANFAAMRSRDFAFVARTRATLMQDIIDQYVPKSEWKQKRKGKFVPF